jgi:hypothetical protein
MEKTYLDMQREAQWWECLCIQDIPSEPEHMKGGALKNEKGWIAILENGEVCFWAGRGFDRTFSNTEEARKYFTCIKKSDNKAEEIKNAFNSIMF